MSNTLAVSITADIVDLQTKFVTAKAEVNALTKEMNDLAKQSAAGVLDPAGLAQLQEASRAFLEAKAAAAELSKEIKGTHEESVSLGEGLAQIKGQIGSAFEVTGIAIAVEGIKQLVEVVGEFGERAIQIHSMSEVLGVTTDQFQAMSLAAEEAGVSSETMTRAGERLENVLNEARAGSGAAVERLRALGVSAAEAADPTFKLNDLFGVLKERLSNAATEEETHNELLQILGTRTAAAIEAFKAYDGSAASVARVMRELNGLTTEELKQLAESKAAFDRLGTTLENTAGKYLAMAEAAKAGGGTDAQSRIEALTGNTPTPPPQADDSGTQAQIKANDAVAQSRLKSANDEIGAIQLVTKADLEASKDAIASTKQASAERLAAVQQYALQAAAFYGQNTDVVRAADRQVIAEARAFNEGLIREADKTASAQIRAAHEAMRADDEHAKSQLADIASMIDADGRYIAQKQLIFAQQQEINNAIRSMEQTGLELQTHVYQEQAKMAAELTKINAKETADQLAQWQHLTTSMSSSFTSAITGMLHGTETFGAATRNIVSSMVNDLTGMFVQMGVKWVETELLNATATKSSTTSNIAAHAGEAGAAGVASWAGAPWPIDIGAPAFGASMALEAASFAAAAGGYDVPAGLNPLTQLHAREMVLPRPLADTVRERMADGGGSGGGGGDVHNHHYNFSAMDSKSVERYFNTSQNRNMLAKTVRKAFDRNSPHLR